MTTRSRGNAPEEELFMSRPTPEQSADSPTVEPLRIFKPASPLLPTTTRFYPPPASSSKATLPPLPNFPMPPTNLAPYLNHGYDYGDDGDDDDDDDEDDPYSGPSRFPKRPPYPVDDGARTSTLPASSGHQSHNDTSPRLNIGQAGGKGSLGERRGNVPKPIRSPQSPPGDMDKLFANAAAVNKISTAYQQKPYYPPPEDSASGARKTSTNALKPAETNSMNRFSSTASNSTTRANRGSPPPPETPVYEPGSLPPLPTLANSQAQSAAAQSRLAHYGRQLPPSQSQATSRPWTPTEHPDQQPHGPPTVYQGSAPVTTAKPAANPDGRTSSNNVPVSVLEQDFQRMQAYTPPPAYTSVHNGRGSSENKRPQPNSTGPNASVSAATAPTTHARATSASPGPSASTRKPSASGPELQGHPAFATSAAPTPSPEAALYAQPLAHTPSLLASVTSPPPLPEGWIAHLDQVSGQYYYIHLATQATQWEFPKGPNPIHHDAPPLSPVASTYGNPLGSPFGTFGKVASPMFAPQTPGYAESIMSVTTSVTPSMSGFSGPPPSAGVEQYKIAPANGVYFGPYLRYANMDLEKGVWLGSIVIVTDAPQPATIHIHLSADLSPNPRQLVPRQIFTHQRWTFYKYEMELPMSENGTERWTYAVTSHLGCSRYEFVVAGRHETAWRILAHSNNDFSPSTSQNERAKLGGVSFMWKDVLQKNVECGGFHVQLGLGGQVYGDRLWREVPQLRQWLEMQGRENRKTAQWTARHEEDVSHAYFHYYTSHFDQPFLREAFAQIPHVLQLDDHDIFDSFGSYPDYMQSSQIFKNIGRLGVEMYLLFQHHTSLEVLRNVSSDTDLFTVTGQGWHFVKYLGPAVVVVGPDCRSERTQTRVMAGPTYQGIFPKVAMLPPSVQHVIWMVSVPVIYPRLDTVETLANTFATGKKMVNTTYNIVGRVTSSVAGVVGGKEVVQSGFNQVKKAVGKGGLMGGMLNQFGEIDISDELKDLWTHESKDLERTYLIRTLQGIAHQKGIRMTFLSGDVNTCGAGLVHDPSHPNDHKTMYQIITSPMVASPASQYLLRVLHNNKSLYVPQNGHRSTHDVSDTKEDMMEIFQVEATGAPRELRKLMARRNYVAIVAYDPEAVAGTAQAAASVSGRSGSSGGSEAAGLSKLSLAIDFVVQGDGAFTAPTKYGPVIIPHLEFGH